LTEWYDQIQDETKRPNVTVFISELHVPFSFEEAVARLVGLSGQNPAAPPELIKRAIRFSGRWDGHYFTIYNYKDNSRLHIGGEPALRGDIADLRDELIAGIGAATPHPFRCTGRYLPDGRVWEWPQRGGDTRKR
jgi:hypothetical protein